MGHIGTSGSVLDGADQGNGLERSGGGAGAGYTGPRDFGKEESMGWVSVGGF